MPLYRGDTYFVSHLSYKDYLDKNDQSVGTWKGRGARLLGLEGEVTEQAFERMRQGLDPLTGAKLRQRFSHERENGRTFYDWVFACPKDLSIQWRIGGDERIPEWHKQAVSEAMEFVEKQAGTRVRLFGKKDETRLTGNLIYARFEHDCSRALDPHLHSHLTCGNLTQDVEEGRWKALQTEKMYEAKALATEVYRNILAGLCIDGGYVLRTMPYKNDKEMGFGLACVRQEESEEFSQGSKAVAAAVEAFKNDKAKNPHGIHPSDNLISHLYRETRPDNLIEISTADVIAMQKARAEAKFPGMSERLRAARDHAIELSGRGEDITYQSAHEAVQSAIKHTFSQVSVAKEVDVLAAALRFNRGHVNFSDVQTVWNVLKESKAVLAVDGECTTKEAYQREEDMVAIVNEGVGAHGKLGTIPYTGKGLNEKQQEVLDWAFQSTDWAVNVQGIAGAGKTHLIAEMVRGLGQNGKVCTVVAQTHSAVKSLAEEGVENPMTIASFLGCREEQALMKGRVLIVDEAGMVGGEDMKKLMDVCHRYGARMMFSGDTEQHGPVTACDALRMMEKESRLASKMLDLNVRQDPEQFPAYHEAVKDAWKEPERAFAKLQEMGTIKEVDRRERATLVAEAHSQLHGSTVVVTPSNAEVEELTAAIRAKRKEMGDLAKEGVTIPKLEALNWSNEEKQKAEFYQPGLVLAFFKGANAGKNLEVTAAKNGVAYVGGEVRKDGVLRGGKEVDLAKQAKNFSVYKQSSIEVCDGDFLILKKNDRDLDLTNGERVQVEKAQDGTAMRLKDGRSINHDFGHMKHGWASTSYIAQSKTVDNVIVSGDHMRHDAFYVSVSRARETCQVFTSNLEGLRDSVNRSGARQTAMELAAKAQAVNVAHAHTQQAGRSYGNSGRASVAAAQTQGVSMAQEVSR